MILQAEGLSLPEDEVNDLAANCNGDLRMAVNTLQLRAVPRQKGVGKRQCSASEKSAVSGGGDMRLSGLHLIGKLLHTTKAPKRASESTSRGAATKEEKEWDPEQLLGQCDMGTDACALFVQHNAVEFYSDIGELSAGLSALSDADLFVAHMFLSSVRKRVYTFHFYERL
jgi:hypothetical protein